ncbi:MAG TPA: DUF4199 domain-containing protein [Chitinophagaceae bacterium]
MKKTVLRYGLLSSLVIVILFFLAWLFFGSDNNYASQEIVGYASIIVALLFVFFGIKHYRDHENEGKLSFGQGMKLGVLIVLIPSIAFGLFNVFYVLVLDPQFVEKYYQSQLDTMQKTLSAADFEIQRSKMESQRALFGNPAVNFILMFLTVFIMGVIVTVISSLILKRNPQPGRTGETALA